MAKQATVAREDLPLRTSASEEGMEQRRRLAELIRARMAKPATPAEKRLWQEFKGEVARERLTFRS